MKVEINSQWKLLLTNSVSPQTMQHAALGDGFKRRTSEDAVHALSEEVAVAELGRHVVRQPAQLAIVGVGHAGETDTKPEGGRKKNNVLAVGGK